MQEDEQKTIEKNSVKGKEFRFSVKKKLNLIVREENEEEEEEEDEEKQVVWCQPSDFIYFVDHFLVSNKLK